MADYSTCPYRDISSEQRWDKAVSSTDLGLIDPGIIGTAVRFDPSTRIATAGSCFAQRISETLRSVGYRYLDAEPPPRWLSRDKHGAYGYGLFSGRYGNIYTALQLLQLIQRAFGKFEPLDEVWMDGDRYFDPFRPRVTANGYTSLDELRADGINHLKAVRGLFEQLDTFVFTLGLTEGWVRVADGAALPICPGCGVGRYDPDRYAFVNFKTDAVAGHLNAFIAALRAVNPAAHVVLTVSPVPLVATMEPHHVLLSTSYSKALLRVAAQNVVEENNNVSYFPSYEIVSQSFNSHRYFDHDRRNVTREGVDHVMRCFFHAYYGADLDLIARPPAPDGVADFGNTVCDEEALAKALAEQHSEKH